MPVCLTSAVVAVFRHASLPAFGGILPLSRRIPTILHGITEIPLFKAILCVTESSKIALVGNIWTVSSSKCTKTWSAGDLCRTPLEELTMLPLTA